MDVIDAINARRSVREYQAREVPRGDLEAILAAAGRAPSWANSQPWEVFVLQGEAVVKLHEGFAACREAGEKPQTQMAAPNAWPAYCKAGTKALQAAQKEYCGDALGEFGPLNQRGFDAPVVIYPCMDKMLGHWAMYDIGAWAQTLMLAAQQYGLDTIAAYTLTLYPQVIHQVANIPDNLLVTIGIALGYADNEHGINKLVSPRRAADECVHWVG
jgi:nitroreductase